jgi:polyglutamine-binding protein 1
VVIFRLGQKYQNDRRMMLLKYPLPANWQEIYDPGMSRHYYWNCISDEVSWLPPHHPYSVIGQSAQSLARGKILMV